MSRLIEDLRSIPSTASTSQEDHESNSGSTSSRKLRVTLLSSEWRSTKGGLSTINRELAIQLAKHPSVEVSVYLPQCSEADKRVAASHSVTLIEAEEMPGLEPDLWLSCLPEDHAVDCVIGHGAVLGRQVQIIKRHHHCKWIQVVHTAPEELGMYKSYADAISRGEKKHQAEVKLCEKADKVVAVGPKLAEAFSGYLRACGKDQDVLNLTPGIFSEFSDVKQATEERKTFSVLVFGRGDNEDFQLKGYDIAARAIAELKDEPQPYKLLFVGAPSGEEEKVKDLLLKQGIDRSQLTVRCFNESREQLARLFCEVDVAVMPSRTEGFGLAALEALSAGLPVLVSGNSGLGEALKKVPFASSCVVQSEDPKDWANAIKAVRGKDRKLRLREAKVLRGEYAEMYSWQDHCKRLVERMLAISRGPSADEHNLSKKATVICQDENPSPSEKRLHKGSTKKRQSSKKGKRPLSSSNIPAPKYPRLLKDKGWDSLVLVKLLKKEYKRRSQLRPLLWDSTIQLPIEQVYTRLKIISRGKLAIQVEGDEVNVFDIFKSPGIGEDVMTIVEGSPGIGKTTFCLKLAYDWALGNIPSECSFPKFEFVFLLKCRDIDGDIMEAISEQLLPRDMDMEKSVEKLLHLMKNIHNQERLILIILDGLDELPEKSRHHVDELLQRRILPFCFVLATTRQERGIEVRKRVVFDIHLEIKGYTENDSIAYVRRHFETIGQSPKGERLIEEMQQNTFLHALRNNPLNLLLLCVVYEDCEGKLPTSWTELYQVIVQCLLRRYCAKRNWSAPEDDSVLEKTFEKEILALGELAWLCLLSDRYGFRESELDEFESRYPGLVARELGLLYKEECLKRLKPEHEYCFLHKTFQEYVAAAYIAEKLVNQQFNVFEYMTFYDLVTKYPQVFIFVSGMLGAKATVLFTQIGEELKKTDWNWNKHCNEVEASFFIESFNESGHPEHMAVTLCNIIPFPKVITLESDEDYNASFVQVLMACKNFSNLQTPVELYADTCDWDRDERDVEADVVESYPQLTTTPVELYADTCDWDRDERDVEADVVESCPQLSTAVGPDQGGKDARSKEGKRPLTSSSTLAPKSPKTFGDEGALPETKSQKQSYIFSRIINSEGGMMIGDGVKLVVPPGAVEKPLTISAAFEDPFRYYRLIVQKDLENDIVFAAPVIKLRPSGQVFKIPVKLTTKFTISVSKKTDVIVLHGTEGRDGISWQDVTHYSTIDEASEEVTTEMEHFTVRLVLVRRTLICLKSIAYWLTSFSFHYTLSVLMKKSDKGSKLNLVLMSQEFYNEEFYREHSDTSALVQLKRKGFKELDVPPIDGQHDKCVYNNEKLRVSICLEENCKLVDTEERHVTVQSAVWWARGHVEEVNIDRNIDISVIRVNVKIQRENGQDFSLYFGESELLCIRSLLGVQGAIFNLKPIARKLLVPEQTFTQIEKFWKDEDKQLEIVLEEWKEKTDEKQNHHNLSEILESLKHEDYKITERGQMHIRNLRQVEGKDQQCENFEIKKLYFQKEMQAVFKMALNDCLIELEGSKLDDYAERQKSIQERYDLICSSSASGSITKTCPIDIPKLVQDIKEIFHHKSKTDRPNGLRGLFEEEVDAFRFKIQEAQSNKNLGGVVSEVGNVLAKLCENNRGDRTTAAQIQMWSRSLMTPLMLDFLEQFFKRCPEDCRLLKRLRNLSEKQNEIMDRSRDGDELLLKDASNTAKRLMDFAKFEPSKLVRFQLKSSAGSDVACNSGIIGHERNHDVFSQEFTITYGPSEKLQIHPIAWTVRFDGEALEEKPERCSCILSFTGTRLKLSYDWPFKKLTASNVQSAGDFNTPQDSTATSSSTTAESEARGATQSEATPGRGANASTIRPGNPEAEVLERLSIKLGSEWKALARRLKFEGGDITSFEAESGRYSEKVFKMLREWKYREGSEATYSVLYSALSDELVRRKDLAETFCLNH